MVQKLVDIGFKVSDSVGELNYLLQSQKCLILLDGFDEVPHQLRRKVLVKIRQLNERFNCPTVVSSRPNTEICREPGIINWKLHDLDESQIIDILTKISSKEELELLQKLIQENSDLKETVVTPILVNLLYISYPYLDKVPRNGVDFYEKLFMTLYQRHDKMKNLERKRLSRLSDADVFNIFSAFCFISIQDSSYNFSRMSLEQYIQKALKINLFEGVESANVIEDIINITCLIQEDGYDNFVFLHKSVQEYHAAIFIKNIQFDKKCEFFEKASSLIDSSDKFDNVLIFLQFIDQENYSEHFVLKKLNNENFDNYLTHKNEFVEDLLQGRTITFESKDDEKIAYLNSRDCLDSSSYLDGLSFILNKNRDHINEIDELIDEQYTSTDQNRKKIRDICFEEDNQIILIEGKSPKTRHLFTCHLIDFLKLVGGYDNIESLILNKLDDYHQKIYLPTTKRINQKKEVLKLELTF